MRYPAGTAFEKPPMSDLPAMPRPAMPRPAFSEPAEPSLPPLGLPVLLTGAFVVVFDIFVVNVAIPSLKADLGADFSEIGLVIAVYALAFGTCLIAGGRLGDLCGRRRMFSAGMTGFAIASFLCGLAPGPLLLIVARFLQGICAAALFPQIYAILRVHYDEDGRRRAFGLLGMTLGLAAIAGQLLGGLIVGSDFFGLGWRAVFFINLPVGLAAAALSRSIPDSRAAGASGLDAPGVGLAALGLVLLLFPLIEGPQAGWPAWTLGSGAAGLLSLLCFASWEQRVVRNGGWPTVDVSIFSDRGFAAGTAAVLLVYSTPASFFLSFSLMVQAGLGATPFQAGSLLTPMSIGFVAASLAAPRLVERFGTQIIAGGMLLYALGFLWIRAADLGLGGDGCGIHVIVAGMLLFGFGQGLSGPPLLNVAIGFAKKRHAGMAAGIVSTMQQLGAAFGIALAGFAFSRTADAAPDATARYAEAFDAAMTCNAAVMLIAAGLMLLLGRRRTPC